MKPGRIHLPAASTTSVPAGTAKPGPSPAAIFPPRSRTVPPSIGSPSIGTTRPPMIAVSLAVSIALGDLADRGYFVRAQVQRGRGDVLFGVRGGAGAWNGQDPRRAGQQPGQDHLIRADAVLGSHPRHRGVLVRLLYRGPRQERQLFLLAQLDHRLRPAVGGVVPVLHGHDRDDPLGLAK